MPDDERPFTFGKRIADARKKLGLSLRELAQKIKKSDGEPISPQYLNDIEHDRRQPDSDHLIEQFAAALKIEPDVLYYEAGKLADRMKHPNASEKEIVAAFQAFRRKLKG
jgi:transcriptional regulator with XRE-family HTH domain